MKITIPRWTIGLFISSLIPAALWGQMITASVEGIVLDPSGAAVPNAKVRALNTSTNLEVRTSSAADGRYSLPSLPPGGPYRIIAEASGFSTEEHGTYARSQSGRAHRFQSASRIRSRDYRSQCRGALD